MIRHISIKAIMHTSEVNTKVTLSTFLCNIKQKKSPIRGLDTLFIYKVPLSQEIARLSSALYVKPRMTVFNVFPLSDVRLIPTGILPFKW